MSNEPTDGDDGLVERLTRFVDGLLELVEKKQMSGFRWHDDTEGKVVRRVIQRERDISTFICAGWPILKEVLAHLPADRTRVTDVHRKDAKELSRDLLAAEQQAMEQGDRIAALEAGNARLRDWLAMAVAEMSRARGRLETIATCNEDRRIAAALGRTCDCARTALAQQGEG